jgi:hypothetical protein
VRVCVCIRVDVCFGEGLGEWGVWADDNFVHPPLPAETEIIHPLTSIDTHTHTSIPIRRITTHPPTPQPQQVEGLYKNFGDLCPLQELVALKKKYRYRLYLDQTFSFGTFGATGACLPLRALNVCVPARGVIVIVIAIDPSHLAHVSP